MGSRTRALTMSVLSSINFVVRLSKGAHACDLDHRET